MNALARRDFIKLAGAGSGALVLALYLEGCAPPEQVRPPLQPTEEGLASFSPNLYLKIDSRGILTATAFRTEMGQGIRTAIAMILADELDMDWESVRIEQADADPRFGDQITGGSVSISGNYATLRRAAAAARAMLVQAAADQWKADPSACTTANGAVIHPDGSTRLGYGDLSRRASSAFLRSVMSSMADLTPLRFPAASRTGTLCTEA